MNLYTNQVTRIIPIKEGERDSIQETPLKIEHPGFCEEMILDATGIEDGSESLEPLNLELYEPDSEDDWFLRNLISGAL